VFCPVDGAHLMMSERNGIEIDYCPRCRGVWLDRGELDKILERSVQPENLYRPQQERRYDDRGHDPHHGQKPRKRRESFLDNLFDFD